MLNRFSGPSPMPGEAEVKYLDGDFRVVRPGAFVRCAVTNVPIPLEELKYWSVELQEAYATPEAVLQRHASGRGSSSRLIAPRARGARRHPIPRFSASPAGRARARQAARRRRRLSAGRGPFRWCSSSRPSSSASRDERARLARAVAVVIGEAAPHRSVDPGGAKRREEFLRIADAGEGEHLLAPPAMRPHRDRARAFA